MKRIFFLTILILALLLSGCSSDEPAAFDEEAPIEGVSVQDSTDNISTLESYLNTGYENATSPYNQLSLGTLKLAETDQFITVEQAKSLLLLWQASKSLESNTNMAAQEVTAVQAQIVATMTRAQLDTIASMQLTTDDLAAFYEAHGISMPNPDDENSAQRGNGMGGGDFTPEERESLRATRQASESGSEAAGEGGGVGRERKTVLTDEVIEFLSALIASSE
jgi:hypothetical protein